MTYRLDIRWMQATESEVRSTLARLARTKQEEPTAWLYFEVSGNSQMTLPRKEFFSTGAWKRAHEQLREKIGAPVP